MPRTTEELFRELCAAADGWASGDIGGEALHSAVVDYTDAVYLAAQQDQESRQ